MTELNRVHFSVLFTSTFKDMSICMGHVSLSDTYLVMIDIYLSNKHCIHFYLDQHIGCLVVFDIHKIKKYSLFTWNACLLKRCVKHLTAICYKCPTSRVYSYNKQYSKPTSFFM